MSETYYPAHASRPLEELRVTANVTPLEAVWAELRAWVARKNERRAA